jgi:transcriptional regulator with XRE-family HTH domain
MYTKIEMTGHDATIIELLISGLTQKQIAAKIGLEPRYIDHRLCVLRNQYACLNSVELVATLLKQHYEILMGHLLLKRELNNLKVA